MIRVIEDLNELIVLEAIEKEIFKNYWKKEFFNKYFENKTILVCEKNDKIIGYLVYENILDEVEILRIGVKNKYQKKGFGFLLLSFLENKFSYNKLMLEVSQNNKKALNFYKKYGFKEVFIRKNYYKIGEDAILMNKDRNIL